MIIDRVILIATAIGFISGLLISLQEIGFDYLINKIWMGWNITLKKFAFSISSLSFLFGLSAFLLLHWAPAQSLGVSPAEIVPFFLKTGILISIVTPISGQIRAALAGSKNATENASGQE
ncbi:MAG: hypothetical protein AAFN40_09330 [Cyanobacteria bacterium J06560_6]